MANGDGIALREGRIEIARIAGEYVVLEVTTAGQDTQILS